VPSSARLGILTVCVLAFAACSASPVAPEPSFSELRTAPTTVTIAGATVVLEAALWRDFQPIAPPDGAPLIVAVRLPQSTLSIDRIWVVFGDQIFSGTPEQTRGAAEWVLRDGPKWGPNVTVDVVARLGANGSSTQLLRAAGQPINAVF
jgi:hypothetical protein